MSDTSRGTSAWHFKYRNWSYTGPGVGGFRWAGVTNRINPEGQTKGTHGRFASLARHAGFQAIGGSENFPSILQFGHPNSSFRGLSQLPYVWKVVVGT
jgi:hypothetical protein